MTSSADSISQREDLQQHQPLTRRMSVSPRSRHQTIGVEHSPSNATQSPSHDSLAADTPQLLPYSATQRHLPSTGLSTHKLPSRSGPSSIPPSRLILICLASLYTLLLYLAHHHFLPGLHSTANIYPSPYSAHPRLWYESSNSVIGSEKYAGAVWRSPQTLSVTPLLEHKWAKVEVHQVLLEDGSIASDWLIEDVIPHISALVHMRDSQKYVLFRQSKYVMQNTSLAVVGGHVDVKHHEHPLDTAKREVREEMNVVSDEWIDLGTYVVNVNRGHGEVSLYYAKNAYSIKSSSDDATAVEDDRDTEKQSMVSMTRDELLQALMSTTEVKEVKWTACIAMALLHDIQAESKR